VAGEFFEGVHRRARVGVTLGEAVPEGVGDDALAREGDRLAGAVRLWPAEALERLDPGAHLALEVPGADRLGAVRVLQGTGDSTSRRAGVLG
jgi:hypothetical protein